MSDARWLDVQDDIAAAEELEAAPSLEAASRLASSLAEDVRRFRRTIDTDDGG